ncbi:sporulation histidine kinase inhibitor Sda [Peribacillus muralis]|uniref:sporulation histidine kinase inhibitor Sda n=1 Tax=Peribacillus muralis TaxID=264697 RepID=UPI00070B5514|nr:sporulation histidine kinase inhibitor Sda [Peribacillus muralis]
MQRITNDLLAIVDKKAFRLGLDQEFIFLLEKKIKKKRGQMERKLGISGTGRIGRMLVCRTVTHLLKYDAVHGTWVLKSQYKMEIN